MITLIAALSFIGFYALYTTSKKADIQRVLFVEFRLQNNPTVAKAIGLSINFVALIISMAYMGVASGTFLFFVILMTVGSLVVLIAPLRYVAYQTVSVLFLLALFIELI